MGSQPGRKCGFFVTPTVLAEPLHIARPKWPPAVARAAALERAADFEADMQTREHIRGKHVRVGGEPLWRYGTAPRAVLHRQRHRQRLELGLRERMMPNAPPPTEPPASAEAAMEANALPQASPQGQAGPREGDVPMAQAAQQVEHAAQPPETGAWIADRVEQIANHMDRWLQPRPEEGAAPCGAQRCLKRRTSEEGGQALAQSAGNLDEEATAWINMTRRACRKT